MGTQVANPASTTRFVVTTEADAPNGAMDRQAIASAILGLVNWEKAESNTSKRGPYQTTRQYSFYVLDNKNGDTMQIGISVNRYPKDRVGEKAATKDGAITTDKTFKLSNMELEGLDKLAADTEDVNTKVRLMTIKALSARGLVSFEDVVFYKGQVEAAIATGKK